MIHMGDLCLHCDSENSKCSRSPLLIMASRPTGLQIARSIRQRRRLKPVLLYDTRVSENRFDMEIVLRLQSFVCTFPPNRSIVIDRTSDEIQSQIPICPETTAVQVVRSAIYIQRFDQQEDRHNFRGFSVVTLAPFLTSKSNPASMVYEPVGVASECRLALLGGNKRT